MERELPRSFYTVFFFIFIAGNISVYQAILAPQVLEVAVLEVGKGNAVLVHTPHDKTILIDTGPDAGILRALGSMLPMWQRSIDAVILTGTKSSVAGGLPEVESRYDVVARMHVGDRAAPYGTSFMFDNARIEIIAPATLSISYGATTFDIFPSTPTGVYTSNGETIAQIK